MSRAFLKNESADDPVVIPARAPLPPGSPNYVTPHGLTLLRQELAGLETERAHAQTHESDETERTRLLALINGRVGALNQRLATAVVVDPAAQSPGEVRFGATVTLHAKTGPDRVLTIVGVDEADAAQGRIAFTAPIARAMRGKRVGDVVSVPALRGQEQLTVTAIQYG